MQPIRPETPDISTPPGSYWFSFSNQNHAQSADTATENSYFFVVNYTLEFEYLLQHVNYFRLSYHNLDSEEFGT